MRRRALTEGTRAEILAELDAAGLSRTHGAMVHGGSTEKAENIASAMRAVNAGAVEVLLGDFVYRVVGEQRPTQYAVTEGSREYLIGALQDSRDHALDGENWPEGAEIVREFANGATALMHGALVVFANNVQYRVID